MSLYLHRIEDHYQLGIWKIEESEAELLDMLPQREYYQGEIAKFKTLHRTIEWLSTRVLLFKLLGQHHPILYQESGKPYIADDAFYISISHTKGYVAVIVSHASPVGIDIEHFAQRIHKVAHKFIRNDEVVESFLGETTWQLLLHWSAKETMFKSIDDSGIDFKEHLHILPFSVENSGTFECREYKTTLHETFAMHYLLNPDFVLTWQVRQ